MPTLGSKCQALSDPDEAPVRKCSWEFYVQSVVTEEVQIVRYN